jgi:hypothetical protein
MKNMGFSQQCRGALGGAGGGIRFALPAKQKNPGGPGTAVPKAFMSDENLLPHRRNLKAVVGNPQYIFPVCAHCSHFEFLYILLNGVFWYQNTSQTSLVG